MLGDQIKKYRKEKKMSQEELAIPLNVVRQTVSKWENNLSVPDAELLIRLAEVLGISVAELLGTDEQPHSESLSAETLAIELARLNEELAKQVQERSLSSRAEQKRNLILFFSMLSMLFALIIDNTIVSVLLTFACLLTAVIILYRNTALLTRTTTSVKKLGAVRITTLFIYWRPYCLYCNLCLVRDGHPSFFQYRWEIFCNAARICHYPFYRHDIDKTSLQQTYRIATSMDRTRRRYLECSSSCTS